MIEIPETVKLALKDLLKNDNILEYTLKSENSVKKGDNNIADVVRIEIIINNNERYCTFICKISPKNQSRRNFLNVRELFLRESIVYSEIIKEFMKIKVNQNISDINLNKGNNNYKYKLNLPKCLYISTTDNDEFLILEDLKLKNYDMYNRLNVQTYKHINLAMIEIGKFHAMSFLLRDQNLIEFERLIKLIDIDPLFNVNVKKLTIDYPTNYINLTIDAINEMKTQINDSNKLIKKINYFRDNLKYFMINNVNGKLIEPYSVICHGDFWSNNILYKNNSNNIPISAKILDFQMSRYASPVLDIFHYLFCCTEANFRNQHFENIKDVYYNSLEKQISFYGSDPNKLYPRNIFEEHCKSFANFGFGMSLYAIPFYQADPKNLPNLDMVANETENMITNNQLNANKDENSIDNESKSSTSSDNQNNQTLNTENDKKAYGKDYMNFAVNENTLPIFKRRMVEIVLDMEKYNFWPVKS